jgi:hypothetical protein
VHTQVRSPTENVDEIKRIDVKFVSFLNLNRANELASDPRTYHVVAEVDGGSLVFRPSAPAGAVLRRAPLRSAPSPTPPAAAEELGGRPMVARAVAGEQRGGGGGFECGSSVRWGATGEVERGAVEGIGCVGWPATERAAAWWLGSRRESEVS